MKVKVTGHHLEFRSGSSSKFYSVLYTDGVVFTKWGRIGTEGQFKAEQRTDAAEVGQRQFYAKQTKGYSVVSRDVPFFVEGKMIDDAVANGPRQLVQEWTKARANNGIGNQATLALQHYDAFLTKCHGLLGDLQADDSFIDMNEALERFGELKETLAALQDKHDEVATVVKLAAQAVQQRVMTGA